MRNNSELRKKRENEIQDLINNPIIISGIEAKFMRNGKESAGNILFQLQSSKNDQLRWGSRFDSGKVIFRLMNGVDRILDAEYLNFREEVCKITMLQSY